jgi:hypothetical protein
LDGRTCGVRVEHVPEFGCHDDIVTTASDGTPNQSLIVSVGTISIGRVDQGNSGVERVLDRRYRLVVIN